MGSPTFYWYPDPTGSLEKLDLGEGLSDIQEFPSATVEDAYGGDGYPYRSFLQGNFRVRIVLERFGTVGASSLERKLSTLQAHLNRGGFVGFSRDHAKTWSGLRTGAASRGDPLFQTAGNGYTAWSSAGTVATGDEIVIENNNPENLREYNTVNAINSSGDITLGSPLVYSYGSKAIARWRDFYPVLWLPKDQLSRPIVAHDHRRNFTLDVTLEFSVAAMYSLWTTQDYSNEYQSAFTFNVGKGDTGASIQGALPLRDETAPMGSYGYSLEQKITKGSGFNAFRAG